MILELVLKKIFKYVKIALTTYRVIFSENMYFISGKNAF